MKTMVLSLAFLLFVTLRAEAVAKVHMIDDIPIARDGVCLGLPKTKGSIEETTNMRKDAVLKRLRDLKIDSQRYLDPLKFRIVNSGHSNQNGGKVLTFSTVILDSDGGVAGHVPVGTATITHEIGHWIGASMDIRGQTAYLAFKSSGAFKKCLNFDGYSTHFRSGKAHNNDLHETFAEVFAGYVVHPNFMKEACSAGYDFMKDQVFRGELSTCPNPEKKSPIPLPRPRPQIEQSPANQPSPAVEAAPAPVPEASHPRPAGPI
jgi:hypothetical protein